MRLILASKSPRRRQILGEMGYSFEVLVAECDETYADTISPRDGVELLARRKGAAVADTHGLLSDEETVILSSDTLVDLNGVALGKPVDEAEAAQMLRALSGAVHYVHTGVAVRRGERVLSGVATTAVYFHELTDAQIDEYVRSGEPMDKAGAYGIQGAAGKFVSHIDGDFDTVVGLSAALVRELIEKI